jgi:hypothetical protein
MWLAYTKAMLKLFALLVLGLLLLGARLAEQAADDLLLRPIVEHIQLATGLKMPGADFLTHVLITYGAPLFAAAGILHLYGRHIERGVEGRLPIREQSRGISRYDRIKTFLSGVAIVVFAGLVLFSQYREFFIKRSTVARPFANIAELSDIELRDRALNISEILHRLDMQYNEKRQNLESVYTIAVDKFKTDKSVFDVAKREYDNAVHLCNNFGFLSGTTSLTVPSLFGGSNVELTPLPTSTPCTIPEMPVPPSEPAFPTVPVDSEWRSRANQVTFEANAIWEVLHHRQGRYIGFFEIPNNYNSTESGVGNAAEQMKTMANQLR